MAPTSPSRANLRARLRLRSLISTAPRRFVWRCPAILAFLLPPFDASVAGPPSHGRGGVDLDCVKCRANFSRPVAAGRHPCRATSPPAPSGLATEVPQHQLAQQLRAALDQ